MPAEVQELGTAYSLGDNGQLPDWAATPLNFAAPNLWDTSYDIYAVTYLWGHFLNVSSANETATDWGGSLSVNGAAIVCPIFAISFEAGQDSVLPKTLPYKTEWASITSRDFDGIAFLIFLKRGVESFAAPWLTFDTPPFKLDLPFEKLVRLIAYYKVDDNNGVAIFARQIKPLICKEGLLKGEWTKVANNPDSGYFSGVWMDDSGNPTGVYAGRYWTTNDGCRLMEGWVSGYMTTQIIARMKGIWWYDDPRDCILCGEGYGRFKGRVAFVNSHESGIFEGEFGDGSLPPDDKVMPMTGKWRLICPHSTDDNNGAGQ
jgi:hypothetical protein